MAQRIGRFLNTIIGGIALVAAMLPIPVPAAAQAPHTLPSPLFSELPAPKVQADSATELERNRPAEWVLAQHRKLESVLTGLAPQRKGVVDAYVVTVALDSDPVFAHEAREAGKVLARRYGATGHTIVLAGPAGKDSPDDLPHGSPANIAAVLARVAEVMDPQEDVLVLYTTSHGAPFGIVYSDGDQGYGALSPYWLRSTLNGLHIRNRLLIISACFSGIFAPELASDSSVVITAAAFDRTSFGCVSENDWTFFGDAMINHALRQPAPLAAAFDGARTMVGQWETQGSLIPSRPQIAIPQTPPAWLATLDGLVPPTATDPVGRPAVAALDDAKRHNH